MAKQKGIIKIEGTIGDLTFLKTADGYLVREKSGVSADRIATDPAFQRTRENGAEFGRAGKGCKLLRGAIRSVLQSAKDHRMVGRLTKEFIRVIQADSTSIRGARNVIDGEAELLAGFDFNSAAPLGSTLFASYQTDLDRVTGLLSVDLAPFIPATAIAAPAGATHFKLLTTGTAIDFEAGNHVTDTKETGYLPLDGQLTAAISHQAVVPVASPHPLFLLIGIQFFQEVNGGYYPLMAGAFNPLKIVGVSGL